MGHRVLAKERNPARCSFHLLLMVRAKAAGIFFLPLPLPLPFLPPRIHEDEQKISRQSKCSSSRINKDEHPKNSQDLFLSVFLSFCLSICPTRTKKREQEPRACIVSCKT